MVMYAYKWVELKPNDDVNFVRPMSYPGSFWPDTAESATIMAGAVSYLKSLGAIKQFYKLTGNLLECYTIFNTKENAEAWLTRARENTTRLKSAPTVDEIPASSWTSEDTNFENFLKYVKLRYQVQNSLATGYTYVNTTEVLELSESDLDEFTENTSW